MRTVLLLVLITISEATIGVFVKLTDGRIPVQTLTFYAMGFAAAFFHRESAGYSPVPRFPRNNVKDTAIIGVLIAAQGGVFNFTMTLVPIAKPAASACFRIRTICSTLNRCFFMVSSSC